MVSDGVVAVFPSGFEDGDVRLVYCPHRRVYELCYVVSVRFLSGVGRHLDWSTVTFDACDYAQVAHMLVDAKALADTPLIERC